MRRLLFITAFILLVAAASMPVTAAAKAKIDKPCTLLTVQQIETAFGGPVAEPPRFDETFVICDYSIGDVTVPPGGIVTVSQLFPGYAQTEKTPRAAFLDQRAVDQVAEYELADVSGVGRNAYLNLTTATIVFQTKAMLISIQWQPGSTPTEPPEADQKQLIKLAKLAAKNAPTKK